jgi:hypothetical protein
MTPNLSIDQEFSVIVFTEQIKSLDRETSQKLLVQLYTQLIQQQIQYRELLKHKWGIEG